jgi:putative Holliday junction resolvase
LNQWQPDFLVVGLPYNMDGSDSELLLRATKFGNRLHGRFHLPCFGIDERLSSIEAQQTELAKPGEAIDSIAACIILETWFSELALRKPR